MTEAVKPFSAGIIDFNQKRMTPEEAISQGLPDNLHDHFADWRQYPLNIATHFPDGVSWFSAEQPWFFRTVLSNPEQTQKLQSSDVLILSGSGMSAYRFQEEPNKYFSEEEIKNLETAQTLVRNQLAEGKFVLGICFGGQLGLHAIGGKIGRLPNNITEAGWLDHNLTFEGRDDKVMGQLPDSFYAPHFHNDYVEKLPEVGSIIHTDNGDITVTKAEVLAIRRGYLDKDGHKNTEKEYIMASKVEFDNGARYYQIQPHPEMATMKKANFLVRMNKWLGDESNMGSDYYKQAMNIPQNVDFRVSEVIPKFISVAKKHLENKRGVQFIQTMLTQNLFEYLLE
jgi:GMP synthase-like glutamine amidotransferase